MKTLLLKAERENIKLAAEIIRKGGLVAFPTETVYGLGADATNGEAVAKIFLAKGRPYFDPIIVHIGSEEMLPLVVKEISDIARKLSSVFWPGPLTLILPKTEKIPNIVSAGLPTVAVRMPKNEIALNLINEAGVPIAAPSANSFGRPSPTSPQHVLEDLDGKIDLILDGGETQIGVESTVLDLTVPIPTILRPGGISKEALEEVLGEVSLSGAEGVIKSPGQLKKHYSPKAQVILFSGEGEGVIEAIKEKIRELKPKGKVGLLLPEEKILYFKDEDVLLWDLGSYKALDVVAKRLFYSLRSLDREGVDFIIAIAPPKEGIGLAIYDRLFKAAGSQKIDVVAK